ncbi:MAG: cupin domain-containing protein [Candidatus Omnitrophica bacterium]|nr:cupin domain-containing protein [Candidatus Omnitrophota bacterium]
MREILSKLSFLFAVVLLCLTAGCGGLTGNKSIQQPSVCQLAKSSVSWDGALLPAYPKGQPEITILRIVIPPGGTLVKHKHPVINAGVLTKGKLMVQTEDGKTLHLRAGEGIVEVVNTLHYGKNEGEEPVEITVFYAGSKDEPITVYKPD